MEIYRINLIISHLNHLILINQNKYLEKEFDETDKDLWLDNPYLHLINTW